MELFALILIIFFGLTGFIAIFFTNFGTLIIFIGAVLFAVLTNFQLLSIQALLILLLLYLCGEILEYVFIIVLAKKFGASNLAVFAGLIGGGIGALIGTMLFGIGIFLSTLLGIFLGIFLAEFLLQRDALRSLKAASGGAVGRILCIGAKVIIALGMFAVIIAHNIK